MADDHENEKELIGDNWLSKWELQCLEEWDRSANMDEPARRAESEDSSQKLWLSFQNSASSIAQLYKEGSQNRVSLWVPFQNCASSVTTLHRDSQDALKKAFDLGCQHGSHRRTRDLLNWSRKKRRHIRREDLIGYMCGKSAPLRNHHHYHHRASSSLARTPSRVSVSMDRSSPRHAANSDPHDNAETDLQPFRDALALQGLNGAMSNVSMERGASHSTPSGSNPERDDFHYFLLDEMARHCESRKRSSNADARMDSPSRKRSRYYNDEMDI